jgi:aryl-alcohol dehydrogenase-like predicted oxidoreductase
MPMKQRRFGRTGLQVSEVVFGAGFVGGIIVLADDDTRRRALRRALDAGINWIDTAPLYGQGRSETALGWLLAEIPDKPYLSTKVRVDFAKPDLAGQVERSMAESLKRLKRDSVDLLQLHNAIDPANLGQVLGGALEGLERMRAQKLTRFIGLTALGETPSIVRAIDSGRFDAAQVYYNLLNPSAARAMPAAWTGHDFAGVCAACQRHDVAMMNIRTFASGVLATDARHGREIALTDDSALEVETQRAHAALAALGRGYGTGAQAALRFSLANPEFACVVIGLAELAHLEEALAAQAMGPLPAEAIAKLEPVYARGFN